MGQRDTLTDRIIGASIEVHRLLGPGLLESAYEACLCWELADRGLSIERQVPLPVFYKQARIDLGYRIDVLVEKQTLIELKTVDRLGPLHSAQIITYLKLSGIRTGLLLNFNALMMRDGIRRF